jgi:hypothetical protein
MTDKEVMQQALEALEGVYLSLQLPDLLKVVGPITALREALAQPEQVDCPRCGHVCSQRPWVGLTDEDVNRESAPITSQMKLAFHAGMYVAQQVLKERNT